MAQGRHKLTHEDVKDRLIGTGVRWVGRYEGSQVKVQVGCEKCGHEWKVIPGNLFTKTRCPACYEREKRGLGRWDSGRRKHNPVLADHGEWLVLDIGTPKKPDAAMLIDWKDFDELVTQGLKRIHVGNYGYALGRVGPENRLVHRMILGGAKEVDHINQDKLDNRRANLRAVESWQNQANRGMRKTNTSGIIGVYFNKDRWRAQLVFRGKTVLYKKFKTKEEAALAVAEARREHCGEYAPQKL